MAKTQEKLIVQIPPMSVKVVEVTIIGDSPADMP